MIKIGLVFVVLTVLIWGGLLAFQKMSSKQALGLTKSLFYATISSLVAVALMVGIVILF